MKTVAIEVQNLKCHGCAHTIETQLSKIEGVSQVEVNNNTNQVSVNITETEQLETIIESLSKMGYPTVGEDNGPSLKAKSLVSCAVGRITK